MLQQHITDILDSLGEGVFTIDKDFRIGYINTAAERILGINRYQAVGGICKRVLRSNLCRENCPIAQVITGKKNIFNMDGILTHSSGEQVPVKLNAALLKQKGKVVGGVISFYPIKQLKADIEQYQWERSYYGLIGNSKPMREIYGLIDEIADSDASVLIQGESGTGKELIANAIQKTSLRRDKPFVKINCSVFSPQLLASELFGHVKGAFTGAIKDRVGRFELADGGTLFLDEVAEMNPVMQLQLLRVLQEGTFVRVGDSISRQVDVRIIAATNKNLEEAVQKGEFREDLYYRLNVIPIEVPPLRERREDIPFLVQHFIKKIALQTKKNLPEISDSALDYLMKYEWPGNVRELENAIAYAMARTKEEVISECKLPPKVREFASCPSDALVVDQNRKYESDNQFHAHGLTSEKERILDVLNQCHWNKSKAAAMLGIGRTTLWRKMKLLGIDETQ
ncbi:MAG: sigma 54-interacting transcriptional regulator [Calditrichia bacterium]